MGITRCRKAVTAPSPAQLVSWATAPASRSRARRRAYGRWSTREQRCGRLPRCGQRHSRLLALHAGEAIGDSGQRRQAVEFVAQRFGRGRRVADDEPRPRQPALLGELADWPTWPTQRWMATLLGCNSARSAATRKTSRMSRSRTPVSSARCSTTFCRAGALLAGRQSVNQQSIDLSVSWLNDGVAIAYNGIRPKPQPPRPPRHTGRRATAARPRRRACRDSGRRPAPSRSRGASARCAR